MKQVKSIFCGLLVALVVCVPAVADNGCENDDNDAIVAELALCSTHAYNIAETKNPTGADKELMRDVVAMKTTLITQQMYKQYEQMESMLRRLKTQLEKAVLTTGLEAKGASSSSSSSSSSFRSSNRNIYLAGVSDCNNELTSIKVFECLSQNLTTMYNTSNNGDNLTTELRKQLAHDFGVMKSSVGDGADIETVKKDEEGNQYDCTQYKDLGKKKRFQKCMDELRAGIRKGYEAAQEKVLRLREAQ